MEEGKAFEEEVKKQTVTEGEAMAREGGRQQQLEELKGIDRGLTKPQVKIAIFYLSLLFFMYNIPFSVISSWAFVTFVKAIKPSFVQHLPGRDVLSNRLLDETHAEVMQMTQEKLDSKPGKLTLGMDGHKDGNGRAVITFTRAKIGICAFVASVFMKVQRATGKKMASLAMEKLGDAVGYMAVVADNTAYNITAFGLILAKFPWLLAIGCAVHAVNLLIKDVAKVKGLRRINRDVCAPCTEL